MIFSETEKRKRARHSTERNKLTLFRSPSPSVELENTRGSENLLERVRLCFKVRKSILLGDDFCPFLPVASCFLFFSSQGTMLGKKLGRRKRVAQIMRKKIARHFFRNLEFDPNRPNKRSQTTSAKYQAWRMPRQSVRCPSSAAKIYHI